MHLAHAISLSGYHTFLLHNPTILIHFHLKIPVFVPLCHYSYHFKVIVKGQLFYSERDENRKFRCRVIPKNLKNSKKIETDPLRKIAQKIKSTFDKISIIPAIAG